MADDKDKAAPKEEPIPEGFVKCTVKRLEIINGVSYGAGTYYVPEAVKKELERRQGGGEQVAGGTAPTSAPASAPGPAPAPTEEISDESPVVTYSKELQNAGIRSISELKGMSEQQIQARVPGLTPVGAAKLFEAANQ